MDVEPLAPVPSALRDTSQKKGFRRVQAALQAIQPQVQEAPTGQTVQVGEKVDFACDLVVGVVSRLWVFKPQTKNSLCARA